MALRVAVITLTPPSSWIVRLSTVIEADGKSLSVRLIVTCWVPLSDAPETSPISIIIVSVNSTSVSSIAVIAVVAVSDPKGIVIEAAAL